MGSYSQSDLEYMFWNGIRNGTIGTVGAKGDPGGWNAATSLGTADLNTIMTPGLYRQDQPSNATPALNYPIASAGSVEVFHGSDATSIFQRYTAHNGGPSSAGKTIAIRRYVSFSTSWSAWCTYSSTRIDQTAGRAIYQFDHLNNREQLVYGDTGWRDITASSVNATNFDTANASRLLYIRRQGYEVTLSGQLSVIAAAPVSYSTFCAIPAGFRFDSGITSMTGAESTALQIRGTTSLLRALTIGTDVAIQTVGGALGNMTAGDVVNVCMKWTTSTAWPTVLPGTAVGTIPNL